jgi:hypothetical protein
MKYLEMPSEEAFYLVDPPLDAALHVVQVVQLLKLLVELRLRLLRHTFGLGQRRYVHELACDIHFLEVGAVLQLVDPLSLLLVDLVF